MSRRPSAPRPSAPRPRRAAAPAAPARARRAQPARQAPETGRAPAEEAADETSRRTPSRPPAEASPASPAAAPATTRSPVVGRPRTPEADAEDRPAEGRVVQAAERFRELVAGRPWRRRRRAIILGTVVTALVLIGALVAVIYLPALQVHEVTVQGTGYLDEEEVRAAASTEADGSMLLLPAGTISERVEAVPGVATVEVERVWPDEVRITVTETAPIALLTRVDGATAVIGEDGEELPAAAGEGQDLVPLTVAGGSADPEAAASAMSAVLGTMPESLRGGVTAVTASSASDVTLELALEDSGTKTVVWGDSRDAELKAEVVHALLGQPGSVIDVSSPVAPVTR